MKGQTGFVEVCLRGTGMDLCFFRSRAGNPSREPCEATSVPMATWARRSTEPLGTAFGGVRVQRYTVPRKEFVLFGFMHYVKEGPK